MKYIALSFTLAIIALLCGCANLGTFMQPRDPNVVSAEASASSAEKWVSTFLGFVQANPQLGLGEKAAAENLNRSFDPDLKNLYGTLALYKKNPMANREPLDLAIQRVTAHEQVAKHFMTGPDLRGQGAPFAPLTGGLVPAIAPPGAPPTAMDAVLSRLDGIRAEQVSQGAALKAQIAHGFHMLHTNLAGVNTNAPPPIPGK